MNDMEILDQYFQNLESERFKQSKEKTDIHFILLWFAVIS